MSGQYDLNELFGVAGLIAVITGGGSGIGLMMAQALEANGAIVYVLGRRLETLERAAKTAKHGKIFPIQADATSKESLVAAAEQISQKHGYINVLIPNAGIGGPTLQALPANPSITDLASHFLSWSPEEFTETFAINSTGVFFTVAAFLKLLDAGNQRAEGPASQIIATTSIGAFNRIPLAGFAYGGSKSACVHIVKQLSSYLAPHGIRANLIAPGFYPSELTEGTIQALDQKEWPKEVVPLRRAGNAQDMGGAILFMCSKAGAYINGNVLVTDGGRLSVMPSTY